jgi:S-adenosyl-L-methionine hydrolase (adenosine-forming)
VDDRRAGAYQWIWLLTDYGRRDGFAATCRGVIATIAPSARVEDITHEVPAHDIRHGAAVLAQTVPYLPPASIVVGIVDPGVGTSRRAVALAAGEFVLVGPDNGLLLWAADVLGGVSTAVELTEAAYLLQRPSRTFAGRDVFAPVAAHLSTGVPLDAFGPTLPVDRLIRLPAPRVESHHGVLETDVLSVDRFGNVQLSATVADLNTAGLDSGVVQISVGARAYSSAVGATFGDVPLGDIVLLVDSAGHVAFAINGGDAATTLDLRPGDGVILRR